MKTKRTLAEMWLWLGVVAIATAGLYSLVAVLARSPQFKALGITQQFFDVALVVYVDLSVLVWFFAMICMGATLLMEPYQQRFPYWGKAGFWCTALATLLMALSPLGEWQAVKSNYIPVLHNFMFLLSLGLLFAGLLASLLPVMWAYALPKHERLLNATEVTFLASVIGVMLGLGGYIVGAWYLPEGLDLLTHYEQLFWLGGHMMQFAFTLLSMVAWLVLFAAMGGALPTRRTAYGMCALAILGSVVSLYQFVAAQHTGDDFMYSQTRVMIEWGGVAPSLMAVWLGWRVFKPSPDTQKARFTRSTRAYASALIVSLLLFFAGGALGLMISGQNVTIPAHYHGMIVGITQALMGLAYVMLPRFGYHSVAATRLAFWQPIMYGLGQFMHIGGLAYCGGYGILRKTAGGFENLAPDIKIALGIFGLGGLLAIVGGILFVVVMLRVRRISLA